MKLTHIAIEGTSAGRTILLDQLNEQLNVVFGADSSKQELIRGYFRFLLFGNSNWNANSPANYPGQIGFSTPAGNHAQGTFLTTSFAEFKHQNSRYRMSRNDQQAVNDTVNIQPLDHLNGVLPTTSQVTNGLDATAYDTFFNVAISQSSLLVQRLIDQIQIKFAVQPGNSNWSDPQTVALARQQEENRNKQVNSLRMRQQELQLEKDRLNAEIQQIELTFGQQIAAIQAQIDSCNATLSERNATCVSLKNALATLNSQIVELRARIELLNSQTRQVAVETSQYPDSLALFYLRLDEIDNQIRRWRLVQSDVHEERVRLRDEMATCDRLSIDAAEHPYHVARQLLYSLENRVSETEAFARSHENVEVVNDLSNWQHVVDICGGMREDLYSLCEELGKQYKHIRHKAAVAEMKQLRRCYHEMDENIKRLVRRRESVLDEIRKLDPAGVELIVLAETQFCECAEHQGYLEARRQFGGALESVAHYEQVPVNTSAEQSQLELLLAQIPTAQNSVTNAEAEAANLQIELQRLLEEKRQLELSSSESLKAKLRAVTEEWQQVDQEIRRLAAAAQPIQQEVQNPYLVDASRILSEASAGSYTRVWLNDQQRLAVASANGQVTTFDHLTRVHQDLVCLAMVLAGARAYRQKSVQVPVVIDDLFLNLAPADQTRIANLIQRFCSEGFQLILLTNARTLQNQLNSVNCRVLNLGRMELADTNISTTAPYQTPTYLPRTDPPATAAQYPAAQYPVAQYPVAQYPVVNQFTNARSIQPGPVQSGLVQPGLVQPGRVQAGFVQPGLNQSSFVQPGLRPNPAVRPTVRDNHQIRPAVPARQFALDSRPVQQPNSYELAQRCVVVTETTPLGSVDLVESIYVSQLNAAGIYTVDDLLNVDLNALPMDLSNRGFSGAQVERWQALALLVLSLPELHALDARVLFACGIYHPEDLDQINERELFERIRSYLTSNEGRRAGAELSRFDTLRIDSWKRSLNRTRSSWSKRRPSSSRNSYSSRNNTRANSQSDNGRDYERTPRQSRQRNSDRDGSPRAKTNGYSSDTRSNTRSRSTEYRSRRNESHGSERSGFKFYLSMADNLEAAPSIGAKTAERFAKIGINSIADFLNADAYDLADEINYKRITGEGIEAWQKQTRLMVQIPNMRVHDVQLLVGCGLTEPTDIASMDAEQLFGIVIPFSETKDGTRILRSGKKPDMEEIQEWIECAQNNRSLQAA